MERHLMGMMMNPITILIKRYAEFNKNDNIIFDNMSGENKILDQTKFLEQNKIINDLFYICRYGRLKEALIVIKNIGIPNELNNSEYIEQFITIWYNILKIRPNYKLFKNINLRDKCIEVMFKYMHNNNDNINAKIVIILLLELDKFGDMGMEILEKFPLVWKLSKVGVNKNGEIKIYKLLFNKLSKISFSIDDYKNFIEKNMINNSQKLDVMLSCCYKESTKLLNEIFHSIIKRSLYYGDEKYMDVHIKLVKNIGINQYTNLTNYLNINIIDKFYKFLPEMPNYIKIIKYTDNLFIPNHHTDFRIILVPNEYTNNYPNEIILYVNKIDLSSKSEYFASMFANEMLESKNKCMIINCENENIIEKYLSMLHLIHNIETYQYSKLPINNILNKSLEYIISVNILCNKYMINLNLNKYYRKFSKIEIINFLDNFSNQNVDYFICDGMNHLLFNQLIYWYLKNEKKT